MARHETSYAIVWWNRFIALMLVLPFFFPVPNSLADDDHYINIMVGERPAGLGGAYTAVSDDTAGLFYNPAGIVFGKGQNLSVSVNSYYVSNKTYKNAIGGNDWVRNSESIVPNYFGLTKKFGPGVAGFSYAVPNTIIEVQDQTFDNLQEKGVSSYRMNFDKDDITINAGPSYAIELGGGFSAGLTLYWHNRTYTLIQNEFVWTIGNTDYLWVNNYRQIDENGLRPLIGFMYAPEDSSARWGLAISKTVLFNASANLMTRTRTYGATSVDELPIILTVKRKFPLNIKLGFAYNISEKLYYTMDASYFTATPSATETVNVPGYGMHPVEIRPPKKAIWNFAGGIEYNISDKYTFRTGFFTNMSPSYPIGVNNSDEVVDIYGGSFCISQVTEASSVDIGVSFSYGSGEANKGGTVETATSRSILSFLGTSHSY